MSDGNLKFGTLLATNLITRTTQGDSLKPALELIRLLENLGYEIAWISSDANKFDTDKLEAIKIILDNTLSIKIGLALPNPSKSSCKQIKRLLVSLTEQHLTRLHLGLGFSTQTKRVSNPLKQQQALTTTTFISSTRMTATFCFTCGS